MQACSTMEWKNLLENVYLGIQNRCRSQKIASFANLNQFEQAALIEREFTEMQQSKDSMLVDFSTCLNSSIDDHLVEHLLSERKSSVLNVEYLSEGARFLLNLIMKL